MSSLPVTPRHATDKYTELESYGWWDTGTNHAFLGIYVSPNVKPLRRKGKAFQLICLYGNLSLKIGWEALCFLS